MADAFDEDGGFVSLTEHPAAEFIARCRRPRLRHRQFAAAG